jgi:predicted nucleic acid-binding protein
MAYVDTNVILANYFPKDRLHSRAAAFFELSRKRKIVSPVSTVELFAVVSRLETELQAPKEILEELPRRRVRALVEFLIKDCKLFLASVPAQAKIKVAGTVLSVPVEYESCIRLAHTLKVKTLDLIHLAYADNLRKWGHGVDVFVTFDGDILRSSTNIQQRLGIEVREPSRDL